LIVIDSLSALGPIYAAIALAGLAAGFTGGLFGVGGGIVAVPALYAAFLALEAGEEAAFKAAVGTSLGVIIVTSLAALAAHRRSGKVDDSLLKAWTPWVAIGAGAGGLAARWVSGDALTIVFALGALFLASRRILPNPKSAPPRRFGPRAPIYLGLGTGLVSSLMGIGGGAMGAMAMRASGRPIHEAIATASGFGVAVAAPGVAAFALAGLGATRLPPFSVGYVNIPSLVLMAAGSAFAAPLGAALAHRVSAPLLSRLFGAFIALAALSMLWHKLT
jgi:uncharacterized membrane protein YfcA